MTPSPERPTTRLDARLDTMTRAKVDDLAQHFARLRAVVLWHIMHWGLSQGQIGSIDQGDTQGPVRHLHVMVAADFHEQVQKAAIAAGMKIAPWLRHMVRQVTITDFPASGQVDRSEEHSHDSRTYGTRFMLRLDDASQVKLQQLVRQFGMSKAEVIRPLIARASDEHVPKGWQALAAEHSRRQMRWQARNHREITR